MKFLIIGRGSMSKRRQRNLQAFGYNDYTTYDITDDITARELMLKYKPDAVIISSPPLTKEPYIKLANEFGLTPFCEADVTEYPGNYYPSRTMIFYPAIRKIKELLDNGTLGKIYTFTHHCGNHIDDWHPGCNKETYYAMKKESGGCKEIFPFELSWLSWLFGEPIDACGMIDKKLDDEQIAADDVYSTVCRLGKITGTVLVDILSRPAIRELRIVGENGTLTWNWNNSFIKIDFSDGCIVTHGFNKGQAAEGYHSAICEEMYENEIRAFVDDIKHIAPYPYTKSEESKVVEMLRRVENATK